MEANATQTYASAPSPWGSLMSAQQPWQARSTLDPYRGPGSPYQDPYRVPETPVGNIPIVGPGGLPNMAPPIDTSMPPPPLMGPPIPEGMPLPNLPTLPAVNRYLPYGGALTGALPEFNPFQPGGGYAPPPLPQPPPEATAPTAPMPVWEQGSQIGYAVPEGWFGEETERLAEENPGVDPQALNTMLRSQYGGIGFGGGDYY